MSNILKSHFSASGLHFHEAQSVRNLCMVPLVTHQSCPSIGAAERLCLKQAEPEVILQSEGKAIAPMGAVFLGEQTASLLDESCVIDGEMPVEGLRSHRSDHNRFVGYSRSIPQRFKKEIHRQWKHDYTTDESGFDAESFLDVLGSYHLLKPGDTLDELYSKYKHESLRLASGFEIVDGQRGAAFLIDNTLVGIEVFPTCGAFSYYCRTLIRDTYAIDAVDSQNQVKVANAIELEEPESLDRLIDVCYKYQAQRRTAINTIVCQALEHSMPDWSIKPLSDGLTHRRMKGAELAGEVITARDGYMAYCSISRIKVE